MSISIASQHRQPTTPKEICRLVNSLFVEQAERTPEATAVISASCALSYEELLRLARGWGRRLRVFGVQPNTLVAVVMEKGWEQIVAVLGIMEAGAAFLPIDPSIPKERLSYLLENAAARIALTQSWVDIKLQWPESVMRLRVDDAQFMNEECKPLEPVQTPDDLAYVLYTSGSTGKPKGAMIAHSGLVNCILETNREFNVSASDRVLNLTALHHDMSLYDIFGALCSGGAIVMPSPQGTRSPDHWLELIRREQITIWNSVPALMEMMLVYAEAKALSLPNQLRLAFLGGDWIPLSAPRRIRTHFGDVQIVSVGGPTETTVWNIWYSVNEVDPKWKSIPYGHPIAHTRYYLLDEALQEVALGEAGEMCVGGVGVLKGYWRNPEQTTARTCLHPSTGETLYRTGDRGRLCANGEIEFLGRIDRQVKIQGQRIELGEIEAALIHQPGVKQAVVSPVSIGEIHRLVAYVVPEGGARLDLQELKRAIGRFLPCFMIPTSIVELGALPLNANGKVDHAQLLLPVESDEQASVETADADEAAVAAAWGKSLKLEHVPVTENFFDLGGNSVLLMAVHAELQRIFQSDFAVTEMFQFPTVRSFAQHLRSTQKVENISQVNERARRQRQAMVQSRAQCRSNENAR